MPSGLKLNPHLHVVFLDGVYVAAPDGELLFRSLPHLSTSDVADALQIARARILRHLGRTLPSGQGLIPGKAVYLPIDTCGGLGGQARIVVQTSGNVDLVVLDDDARCRVHLDGVSFSMSSPASAKPLNLGNNWSPYSTRAVRARNDNGVIRLEGAVKNGNATTIATLPEASMYPTKTVYLVADAIGTSQSAQISISNTGVIKLVAPSLALAASGLSFDGVSFHP